MSNEQEMPRYKCHKEVHALKIKKIEVGVWSDEKAEYSYIITPEEEGYGAFDVEEAFIDKHDPQPGGYYVVYKDGYTSYSPAEAFEDGYTRIG